MKNLFFLFCALFLIGFTSCEPDAVVDENRTANVEVNFKTEYAGTPLIMFADETYPESSMTMRVKKTEFFITDLVLLQDGSSDETELSEVELLKFSDFSSEEAAARGTARAYENIPVGTYSGVRMGIGVNPDLNRATTGEYGQGDPLGQNFWDGWSSYVFAKFEGDIDVNSNGNFDDEDDLSFALHTGSNEAFRTVTLNMPIVVSADENNIISIAFDLQKLFISPNGEVYDIIESPSSHTTGDLDAIIELSDNFANAFSVR